MLSMGKSTISMAIFNSFLYVYQRVLGSAVPVDQVDGFCSRFVIGSIPITCGFIIMITPIYKN